MQRKLFHQCWRYYPIYIELFKKKESFARKCVEVYLPVVNYETLTPTFVDIIVLNDIRIPSKEHSKQFRINWSQFKVFDAPHLSITFTIIGHEAKRTTTALLQFMQNRWIKLFTFVSFGIWNTKCNVLVSAWEFFFPYCVLTVIISSPNKSGM